MPADGGTSTRILIENDRAHGVLQALLPTLRASLIVAFDAAIYGAHSEVFFVNTDVGWRRSGIGLRHA